MKGYAFSKGAFVLVFLVTIMGFHPGWAVGDEPPNTLLIKELKGKDRFDVPFRIGRPFMEGAIQDYPQVLVDGKPVLTQADVKNRWPDGSVKFALLSFVLPQIPAGGTVLLSFRNQETGQNEGYLTAEQMLSSTVDFDARMTLASPEGKKKTVSARDLIEAGAFTYWAKGPVATTVVLADHSAGAAFDMGFDEHTPFRPIFHVTFWPALHRVRVRFIGEAANTEALEDLAYDLKLYLGFKNPIKVYTRTGLVHHGATRWTKVFWMGGAPEGGLLVDHNLAFLKETCFVPNYDTSKKVPEGSVGALYGKWLQAPRDLYDPGLWVKAMPTAGGRPEIGPYPSWAVLWLYTGDPRMAEVTLGQADLAAAWPLHLREAKAGKNLLRTDPPGAGTGRGRVLSISNRPTVCLWSGYDYKYTKPEDRVTPVGPLTDGGWRADGAHQPDPFSVAYTLTGDFFYLEEMYFWASFSAARYNGAAKGSSYGRGPTGAEGGIHDEIRGNAWVFRNRSQTAFLAPDGDPEKSYFTTLTEDAVAIWEGMRNIGDPLFEDRDTWKWGHAMIEDEFDGLGVPPLHHWRIGSYSLCQDPVDPEKTKDALSPWQEHFLLFALGRARELGFPTDALVQWFSRHLVRMLTDPDYDPYMTAAYRMPSVCLASGDWFKTFGDLMKGFKKGYDSKKQFEKYLEDPEHGYAFIAMAAASVAATEEGGGEAWQWMKDHALYAPKLQENPKWAVLPRAPAEPDRSLSALPPALPAATGGGVAFLLDAGVLRAERTYVLLGSLSGTWPGTPLPGGNTLPLNWDFFTGCVVSNFNSDVLDHFKGNLDGWGKGRAWLKVHRPLKPDLVGTTLDFAYALTDGKCDFVSNPVTVKIVP